MGTRLLPTAMANLLPVLSQCRRLLFNRLLSTTAARSADPWLLPNTPEHIAQTTSPTNAPPPEPLPRPGETVETMRARLVYQARKRGTLESDLVLSTFAKDQLSTMDEAELREFDKVRGPTASPTFIRSRLRMRQADG